MRQFFSARRISAVLAILLLVAGAATLVGGAKSPYRPHSKAFYADEALVNFVRPGLVITINSASITAAGVMSVVYTLTDPTGLPLDAAGSNTPGAVTLAYVASYIPQGQKQYVGYTTASATGSVLGTVTRPFFELPSFGTGGTVTPIGPGQYKYTFKAKAPANFDPTVTTTVAVDGNRDLTLFDMGISYAGTTFNFVPNGQPVKTMRDVIRTESCNRCHDQLAFHGGYAHGVEMCVLCHQPQNTDPSTGNSLDLKVMAHKIHMGSQLPSVVAGKPYQIVGFRNSVSDFSDVTDPADPRRCEVCHDQSTGAAQAKNFMTQPSRVACGACHDDVDFATGKNHPGGFQADDTQCANCHVAQGETPFDASILGAHVVPTDTPATYPQNPNTLLPGLNFAITSVNHTSAGQTPNVHFTVRDDKNNNIALSKLSFIQLTLAGPTTDYGYTSFGSDTTGTPGYVTESAAKASCAASGDCSYTFTHAVPSAAKGTYTVAGEARMSVTVLAGTTSQQAITFGAKNPVVNFSVDGSTAQPRRSVVALSNCNGCHVALSIHGTLRNNTEYCVLCHNPSNTDISQRVNAKVPADKAAPAQSIDFSLMVHRIHDGVNVAANGGKPYVIVGFGGSHNDFSDVLFPAMSPEGQATDLKNCSMCHANGSEQNLPVGLNPVSDPQGWINPTQATAAACGGCHVGKDAASHFLGNTTTLGEACTVCHASDAQFGVDKMHAQ